MRAMLPSANPSASLHCAKSVTLVALLLLQVWSPCLQHSSMTMRRGMVEGQQVACCAFRTGVRCSNCACLLVGVTRLGWCSDCSVMCLEVCSKCLVKTRTGRHPGAAAAVDWVDHSTITAANPPLVLFAALTP